MNVKSVEKEKGSAKVVVEIEKAEFENALNKAYAKCKKDIMIPGFRKGKAPRKVVESMYGAKVFYEEERQGTHDEKVFRRELGRLETSLKAAGERDKLCFLHYPPKYAGYECPEILALLEQYGVRACYYGHLHAESLRLAFQGGYRGTELRLVSADYVNFKPVRVLP